ncbi:NADP-dependent oxidoreductase [Gordonia sp. NPDC003376]
MKKVIFAEYGGPDVLRLVEADEPHARPGTIRIAVRGTGVNAHDWRSREGQFRAAHPDVLPTGVGLDASGVVDEVGEGVTGVAIGDEVFGEGHETYAENAVLSAWVPKPANLSFEETAGYASVVESSLRVMREVGIQPGETLLVSGASGAVGSTVLQVARERGVTVIGVAGPHNQDYLRSLGAHATSYGDGWLARVRAIGRVDAALDVAGSGVITELVALTGDPDRVVSLADLSAPELGVRFSGNAGSVQAALDEALELIAGGRLRIPVEKTYSLSESAQAQADSQAGHARGRRVIVI